MKPPSFAYRRPDDKDEALALLAELGDDAKILAGGQSLGPLLNMRLATPSVLVDINDLVALSGRSVKADGSLTVGALVRHRGLETDIDVRAACPLISEAVPYIGHRAIRNRGTMGGSLAHADPAAELPAVIVALRANVVVESTSGSRSLPAERFFASYYTSEVAPDELITEVRFPVPSPGQGTSWKEFAPRHGDYAYVGVAAVVTVDERGPAIRLTYSGVASTPVVVEWEPDDLGPEGDAAQVEEVAHRSAQAVDPAGDLAAPADYKRRLVFHLTRAAVETAMDRARAEVVG